MRGCELKGVGKEGCRFDFRCARSLPLGPTITGRVTGASRNLHGDETECQGDCSALPRKMAENNVTADHLAKPRRLAERRRRPLNVNLQIMCSGHPDPAPVPSYANSVTDPRARLFAPMWCRHHSIDRYRR